MAREMKLPQLGEDIETGIVLNILVEPGEHVEKDQVVLELETDKATTEVPADFSGVVRDIQVDEGAEIKGGQTILTYEPEEKEEARAK
ncbi:MAG: biotin/lipoyl-containing protein, partial [Bradymonadaceae bacterium]